MKKIINFVLDLTVMQKVFILLGLFTLVSEEAWLQIFQADGFGYYVVEDTSLGIYVTCLVGIFLF